MTLDLQRDESVVAVADTVARYCSTLPPQQDFRARWRGLAELGLFSLPHDFGELANAAIAAGMEGLGRGGFQGPVADTIVFSACAPADLIEPVVAGDIAIAFGRPPLVPYPDHAALLVTEIDGQAVLFEVSSAEPVKTLAGDRWARVDGMPGRALGPFAPWRDRYDVAIAAWLVGAGLQLIEDAAAHASQRVQFGRPIGEFQAVSAPLARAVVALDGAKILVDAAAAALDTGSADLAIAARLSASRAARQAAITAHQTYGAFGVLETGPVFGRSRLIRQRGSQFPEERPIKINAAALRPGLSLGLVARASIE